MFKNIFNTPESIRSAILGQDEIRARSQQGLQAVRSGVESLRTVLANNPVPSESAAGRGQARDSNGAGDAGDSRNRLNDAKTTAGTSTTTTTTRGRSGSWSLLPPSLSGRSHTFNSSSSSSSSSVSAHTERNRTGYRPGVGGDGASESTSRPNSLTGSSSITESVAESIKSLSTGLGLAQFAGGLGLTGGNGLHQHHGSGSGSGPGISSGSNRPSHSRKGTVDTSQTSQSSTITTASGSQMKRHPMLLSNRSRVWSWNGQENGDAEDVVGGGPAGLGLKTGVQTEEAARETEARMARLREQEDVSLARSRRMPEVEQMAQRYQDSWKEIHEHTARNAEKADNADEILGKVLELCQRHVEVSSLMETECKELKDLGKTLDDMVVVSGNIHKKLMGLEAMIEKLEEGHEEMSLADWKKSKVVELDRYMESKRNELWDKAEVLSTRSEQFQKEEAARKLKLYQNQFESDMAHFRRTQEEREQELQWKADQQDPALVQDPLRDMSATSRGNGDLNAPSDGRAASSSFSSSATKSRDEFLFGARIPSSAAVFATASKLLSSLESARSGQGTNFEALSSTLETSAPLKSPMPRTREPSTSLLALEDTEDWKDKEDLDNFLGPATEESVIKIDLERAQKLVQDDDEEEDEEKKENVILQDVEYEEEAPEVTHGDAREEEEDDEETTEEESSEEDDEEEEDLDPIAKARQARAAAAAAAATGGPKGSTGSTISAFSALAKHPSTS